MKYLQKKTPSDIKKLEKQICESFRQLIVFRVPYKYVSFSLYANQ